MRADPDPEHCQKRKKNQGLDVSLGPKHLANIWIPNFLSQKHNITLKVFWEKNIIKDEIISFDGIR